MARLLAPARHAEQRLAEQGSDPAGNSPAEFKAELASDYERIAKVISDAGIAPN